MLIQHLQHALIQQEINTTCLYNTQIEKLSNFKKAEKKKSKIDSVSYNTKIQYENMTRKFHTRKNRTPKYNTKFHTQKKSTRRKYNTKNSHSGK